MTKKISNIDALQFYLDNGLGEVISENPQNRFAKKSSVEIAEEIVITPNNIENKITENFTQNRIEKDLHPAMNFFGKQVNSSSEAIASLAKRSQNYGQIQEQNQEQNNMNQETKFTSFNDIVAKAKKMAKAAKDLQELRQALEKFDGCNLKKTATNTVFCDGNPNSKIMVIGEAPGNHEDLQGIPFCGDSGKVLNEMFAAINMTRQENFYISNVIFWRPPGNRRPTDEELAICRPFVERHIQLINPQVLVLVGATAMTAVLGLNDPVSKIRGQFMDFAPEFLSKKIKTFTIFHPSYLMRQPMKKKVAWQDMLALEGFLKE